LRSLGYEEGRNVTIEYRYAAGRVERLPSLAAELAALPVDVIFSVGTVASKAAVAATTTIPIVFSRVGDPVRYGLVASLPRPGGNATGATLLTTDLAEKRLQLLKEMVPGTSRVAVLHEQNFAPGDIEVKQLVAVAPSLDLQVQATGVAPPQPSGLEAALPDIMKESPQALFVGSSGWFEDVYQFTLAVASKGHLPAMYVRAEYVDAGGLISYGVNYPDMYRSAVEYVVKILNGAKPSDLPVWQPVNIELVINRGGAKALDLIIPQSLVGFAERIVD
jgi:putative tryptophan/tyrosine transport system substrate-binding protein